MENLKKKLNECIALYGPMDKRTLEISQKLDKLIAEEMKGEENDKLRSRDIGSL